MGKMKDKMWTKVSELYDELEYMMEKQYHIFAVEEVLDTIEQINVYYSILDDEHIDYLDGVKFAIEKQSEWKVG